MPTFTEAEMAEYRQKKADEKAKAAADAKKTADEKAKEESKRRRAELEASLKNRFLASGGTETEWLAVKRRVIQDALVKSTLEPEEAPEPEKPVIPAPLPRSRYMK
jgi:membrane protein involved in colicin uptake